MSKLRPASYKKSEPVGANVAALAGPRISVVPSGLNYMLVKHIRGEGTRMVGLQMCMTGPETPPREQPVPLEIRSSEL